MLTTAVNDPAFRSEVDSAIAGYFKQENIYEIDYIEHGSDNIVTIVNRELVFRFPRTEDKARRIAFETALLQKTRGRIHAVGIPELVKVHTAPLYSVAKYLDGTRLGADRIQAMSTADQEAIGATVADFIHEFNQAISGPEILRLRTEAGVDNLDEPWPVYFSRVFVLQPVPNERLTPIIVQYYNLWRDYVTHEHSNYAIHDDLHLANLLFTGNKLTGVLDFGDVNAGSIESELRWLYLMGDTVLRAAVERYQQVSGNMLNYDHIRVWAIMHELSTFTDRLARQQTEAFPFQRAQQHLRAWIPDFPL